ncbi:protein-disulfide reductase DsbD family protein [Streptacidiphilus rugosus]|uniref:protein-disulfide reductase DsbD family protein n=1 Tax=Streptacidiphilus rugosus TaxID=405783 RepID=UPI0005673C9A|nr:protein-disulfide reductase DsbD family protein [Streptacidiphilus rugosus]
MVAPLVLAASLLAACASPTAGAPRSAASPASAASAASAVAGASLELNGVRVALTLHGRTLTATFAPERKGFHLYSAALPAGGVDGLGTPTRLAVRGSLTATGPATANVPVRTLHLDALGVDLPVYPDGPVTLSLPVRRNAASGGAEAVVSFGACSETQCLAPVLDHIVPVPSSD